MMIMKNRIVKVKYYFKHLALITFSILYNIKKDIPFNECNTGKVLEYIDLLIDESKYNIKEDTFYYQYRKVRIPFDVELFSKVASEYINENLDYFILMKHQEKLK